MLAYVIRRDLVAKWKRESYSTAYAIKKGTLKHKDNCYI